MLSRPIHFGKETMRGAVQRVVPSRFAPIVVASMGRSGSTLVHDAICRGLGAARFGSSAHVATRLTAGYAWDLHTARLRPGVAYKTHALAEDMPAQPRVKVVFVFGSPVDAAVSVLHARARFGDDWIAAHFGHLRANGGLTELPDRDVLRFADQLDGWTALRDHPVMALKYESLWAHEAALSEFLGFSVTLPPRRARRPKATPPDVLERLKATYGALDARIEAMPGVAVFPGDGRNGGAAAHG